MSTDCGTARRTAAATAASTACTSRRRPRRLLCTAEHRAAVLLEVSVLGAYIRFERGFRYARQRVRSADVGPCGCGAVAAALADAGLGAVPAGAP